MTDSKDRIGVHGYLREVVDIAKLQDLVDKFAKATGVAAIVADVEGIPITDPSNFTRFCQLVRSTPDGEKLCYKSDQQVGEKAAGKRSLSLHQCHCGLIDMAAPLILDGVYRGAALCGQVLLEAPTKEQIEKVRNVALQLGIDEDLSLFLQQIEVVSEAKIRAAGELLRILASYIVEMSVSELTHRQLMKQLEESARMERVMHQLELRALQSQVNPHFLFNTLNAASRLALIEGAGRTEELLHAMARLLRYTLRNIDKIVPLQEELEYISNYLFIQTTRYGDHIEMQIDTEPEALKVMIPVMTLQPIVENAIVHGLEPKEDGGKMMITVQAAGEFIRIEIRDTGLGMDITNLNQILDGSRTGRGHTTGLGLINVHQRLKHCFGENYGMEISSIPGIGTAVVVWIPVHYGKSNESEVET